MKKTIAGLLLLAITVSACRTSNENISPTSGVPINNKKPISITTYSYNQAGNIVSSTTTNFSGLGGNGNSSIYTYNQQERLILIANSQDGQKVSEAKYSYNDQGLLAKETNTRYTVSGQASILSNTYSYDNKGRIITIRQGNAIKNCSYNTHGLLEEMQTANMKQLYSYDGEGQFINGLVVQQSGTVTDSIAYSGYKNGRPSTRQYFSKSSPSSTNSKYYLVEKSDYSYDQYMNLTEETRTSFFYSYSYKLVYTYDLNLYIVNWLNGTLQGSSNDPNRFTRDINRNKVVKIEQYDASASLMD